MIRLRDLSLTLEQDTQHLYRLAARQLGIRETQIEQLTIYRRSVDARKKDELRLVYTVDVAVLGNEARLL